MPPARTKPWGGRFQEATDPAVERFSASVHFDRALARYDLRLSMAHARMSLRHQKAMALRAVTRMRLRIIF